MSVLRRSGALLGGLVVALVCAEGLLTAWPHVVLAGHRSAARTADTVVVAWGDSVTFGYGLPTGQAWPDQLQGALDRRGIYDAAVENHGSGGRSLSSLREAAPNAVAGVVRRGSIPEVVVLLGHNDVVRWKGRPVEPAAVDRSGARGQARWQPRLLRALRWGLALAQGVAPESQVDPRTRTLMVRGLAQLQDQVSAAGGRVWVATYPVPGRPPAGLDATRQEWIETSRIGQMAGNALTRDVAEELGLPLIDLHRELAVPGVWSPDWWLDHIHPTVAGARAIADEVDRHLSAAGLW